MKLDAEKAEQVRAKSKKHESHDEEFAGIRLKEIWDPFGNESDIVRDELTLYHQEKLNQVPVEEQKGPAVAFVGMGVWFAARFEEEEYEHR